MDALTVRLATREDAPAINAILNHYVEHSTATFIRQVVTLDDRLAWFDLRSERHPAVVAEINDAVVGFAALGTFRPREGYAATAELGVYIHQDFHRQGIGRALVNELIARARASGLHALIGGACHESTASIALLETLGFTRVAYFREVGRKFDRWLDVVFLELIL